MEIRMKEDNKSGLTPSVKGSCETLTKEGKSCRLKCVLGTQSCRRHLKWEGECPICIEEFPNWELKCGHRFHRKCFGKWRRTVREKGEDVRCPLCRSVESKGRLSSVQDNSLIQGSLAAESFGHMTTGQSVSIQGEGIEALSNLLQMLLPFPAQMIEQMAERLWDRLEVDMYT